MRPLLKWAGGKRGLVERILEQFPQDQQTRAYHEPFVGGGAVFFRLEPAGGTINDVNPRLMNLYRVVRDRPDELIEAARGYRYEEAEYYRLRDRFNSGPDPVEDAALLLYLNRTCYNGLYRVNSRGEFNVPFGTYSDPTIVHPRLIRRASALLGGVDVLCGDFEYLRSRARKGDLCYMDPPYQPASRTASFVDYSAGGFGEADQARLRDLCVELDARGVHVVQSNSDTSLIRSLYEGTGFRLVSLRTTRMISSKVSSRGGGRDLLITSPA
jgi:DNA adenine methylase